GCLAHGMTTIWAAKWYAAGSVRACLAKMGLPAYFICRPAQLASLPLGDANRGGSFWPCAAVSDHEKPAASTPRSSGLLRLSGRPDRARPEGGYSGHMVRKVLLASPRGYCAGVERAVETVEKALDLYGPPVYVRKQIVHNLHVVRDLEARGAVFVDEETEVPEGQTVVFSAHGVAPSVYAN